MFTFTQSINRKLSNLMSNNKIIPAQVRTPKGFPGPSRHFKITMRKCFHCNKLLSVAEFCDCTTCITQKLCRQCVLAIEINDMKLCTFCKEYTLPKDFCECSTCESSHKECCWECCKEMYDGEKQDHAHYFSSIRGNPPGSF